MQRQWLWFEHQRLHQVEDWPDGPQKNATLAAIASTVAALQLQASGSEPFACDICLARTARVLFMKVARVSAPAPHRMAA